MHKLYTTALLLIGFGTAKANTVLDSIGVENHNGKKLIIHQTVAKETYYSIARRYNVSPKDIMSFNDSKYLQIGVIIKIPTEIPFNAATNATVKNSMNSVSEYAVQAKDNLSLIAEKFGTTVNELKALNNLSNNNLRIGQSLKIPTQNPAATIPTVAQTEKPKEVNATAEEKVILHTVKPQEYLNKIAENYGTTAAQIKSLNHLESNNLKVGQTLKVPATKNINETTTEETSNTPQNLAQNQPTAKQDQHIVAAGENIFTIAQKYGITAYQIRALNNLNDNIIQVGQALKLPTTSKVEIVNVAKEAVKENKPTPSSQAKEDEFKHIVLKGENIFTIAKKYNLTAYQIREANQLSDNVIKVDQALIIPKKPEPRSVAEAAKDSKDIDDDSTATLLDPKLRREASVYGLNQTEEKGTAMWIADEDLDSSKMLVLHRTLPVGRVIKITNPMTNRTTFAKVVGKFTENESTKDLILVMTKAVAESLGALDKRFFCSIVY